MHILRRMLLLLTLALFAAFFGFSGILAADSWIAQLLFYVFMALFLSTAILGRPWTGRVFGRHFVYDRSFEKFRSRARF